MKSSAKGDLRAKPLPSELRACLKNAFCEMCSRFVELSADHGNDFSNTLWSPGGNNHLFHKSTDLYHINPNDMIAQRPPMGWNSWNTFGTNIYVPLCYNDIDMLTVGMYNKGNAAIGKPCTDGEYRMQFSLWCLAGAPLMLGADIRNLKPEMKELLLNKDLTAIDQDAECRPPFQTGSCCVAVETEDLKQHPIHEYNPSHLHILSIYSYTFIYNSLNHSDCYYHFLSKEPD